MAHSRLYAKIMSSQRWQTIRKETLKAHPYCERCKVKGRQTPAKVVHHIKPIESGHSFADYERLAFDARNLQALCIQCHTDIHSKELGSHSKAGKNQRKRDRLQRWMNDMVKRFGNGG